MRILISNDDGIQATGIIRLAQTLEEIGEVTVVAPHRERSTAGHSLTLHKPLRIFQIKPNYFSVTGTPADCIYIGTRHILKQKPDLIVSGINRGANLATDTFYSGTVAAAREGMLFGVTSIAVSLCIFKQKENDVDHYWDSACKFMKKFVPIVYQKKFNSSQLININVPNLPYDQIKGVKLSKMGRRHYHQEIVECVDPRNKKYYWIGGAYKDFENIVNSDCVHVDEGFISILPLKIDITDYEMIDHLKAWEEI